MQLKDKAAIVTGGSRGIGRAISLALAEAGASVLVNYVKNEAAAKEVVQQIEETGGRAKAFKADVSVPGEAQGLADATAKEFDRIDILVNNAGVIRDGLFMAMEDEDWSTVLRINLGGVKSCTKAVLPTMVYQKSGRIINISSTAAIRAGRGQSNYAASKGAIESFTRAMAVELAPKGITVNAVSPGMIETELSSNVRVMSKDVLLKSIPLGRYGLPEDVAPAVVFLASEGARYITGQILVVDGGLSTAIKV